MGYLVVTRNKKSNKERQDSAFVDGTSRICTTSNQVESKKRISERKEVLKNGKLTRGFHVSCQFGNSRFDSSSTVLIIWLQLAMISHNSNGVRNLLSSSLVSPSSSAARLAAFSRICAHRSLISGLNWLPFAVPLGVVSS